MLRVAFSGFRILNAIRLCGLVGESCNTIGGSRQPICRRGTKVGCRLSPPVRSQLCFGPDDQKRAGQQQCKRDQRPPQYRRLRQAPQEIG